MWSITKSLLGGRCDDAHVESLKHITPKLILVYPKTRKTRFVSGHACTYSPFDYGLRLEFSLLLPSDYSLGVAVN